MPRPGEMAVVERWRGGHVVKIAKKDSGIASVTYAEALDVALPRLDRWAQVARCGYFPQRFTAQGEEPVVEDQRRQGRAVDRVGPRACARSSREGGGAPEAAYHGASSMEVPAELAAALAKNRKAKAFFESLDKTNRYSFAGACTRRSSRRPSVCAEKFVAMRHGARRSTVDPMTRRAAAVSGTDRARPCPARVIPMPAVARARSPMSSCGSTAAGLPFAVSRRRVFEGFDGPLSRFMPSTSRHGRSRPAWSRRIERWPVAARGRHR